MIDRHSETWRDVAAWAEGELAKACERLETIGVEPAETENLRGGIAKLRELLAMQHDPEQRVIETTEDYGFQGADEV